MGDHTRGPSATCAFALPAPALHVATSRLESRSIAGPIRSCAFEPLGARRCTCNELLGVTLHRGAIAPCAFAASGAATSVGPTFRSGVTVLVKTLTSYAHWLSLANIRA